MAADRRAGRDSHACELARRPNVAVKASALPCYTTEDKTWIVGRAVCERLGWPTSKAA